MLMKNGNVYRIVPSEKAEHWKQRGFIICEENSGGGSTPPPMPLQDEKPTLQEVLKDIEPAQIDIVDYNHRKLQSNGRYWNQLNVPESKLYCDQEGLAYPENATLKELRTVISAYVKTLPQDRK